MKKLFLGFVSVASILVACGDEASSNASFEALSSNSFEASSSNSFGNSSAVNVPESSAESVSSAIENNVPVSSGAMIDSNLGEVQKENPANMFDSKGLLVDDAQIQDNPTQDSGVVAGFVSDTAESKAGISYGTMTDLRDGKVYKTIIVKMFDGKDTLVSDTWMLEDLAYDYWMVTNRTPQDTLFGYTIENGVHVYEGDVITAGKCFGVYDGSLASCELTLPFQGVCPDGWHLPDTTEARQWRTFLENVDGVKDVFYLPSSSAECDNVDYFYTISELNYDFKGFETRSECAGVDVFIMYDSAVRCVMTK